LKFHHEKNTEQTSILITIIVITLVITFNNVMNTIQDKLKTLIDGPEFGYEQMAQANDLVKQWLIQRKEYMPILEVPEGLTLLRSAQKPILREYLRFVQQQRQYYVPRYAEIDQLQASLVDNDATTAWRTLHLRIFDRDTRVSTAFPYTLQAIATTGFQYSTIMFSTLEAGKTIPPHVGFYCGVVRYHLGLVVPTGCFINVAGQTLKWNPDLYFDDSFPHFASNPTKQNRTVLFLDIVRDLGDDTMNQLNCAILGRARDSHVVIGDVARVDQLTMINE
jgi:beta-hydroxylase